MGWVYVWKLKLVKMISRDTNEDGDVAAKNEEEGNEYYEACGVVHGYVKEM